MAITKTTKVQRCEVYPKADTSAEATGWDRHPACSRAQTPRGASRQCGDQHRMSGWSGPTPSRH